MMLEITFMVGLCIYVTIYMVFGFMWSKKIDVYSWIDFFWASSFLHIAAIMFLYIEQGTTGLVLNNYLATLVLISMYAFWSLRLSYMLWARLTGHNEEDNRYITLKNHWQDKAAIYFFAMFVFEAWLAIVLAIPIFIQVKANNQSLTPYHYVAMALFLISFFGLKLSDDQLKKFKANKQNKGEVCNIGLWNYSRHPNYFFELLIWLSFSLYAFEVSYISLIPVVVMYIFLVYISGIPYNEKQSIISRGQKYVEYQRKTSKLIPWFKKNV